LSRLRVPVAVGALLAVLVPASPASASTTFTFPRRFSGKLAGCFTFTGEPGQACAYANVAGSFSSILRTNGLVIEVLDATAISGHLTYTAPGVAPCSVDIDTSAASDTFGFVRLANNYTADFVFTFVGNGPCPGVAVTPNASFQNSGGSLGVTWESAFTNVWPVITGWPTTGHLRLNLRGQKVVRVR
jgi:hypothetical protein